MKQSSTAHYDETILARLRAPANAAQDGNSDAGGDDAATNGTPATSATEDDTGRRRSRRLLSKHDLHVINNELLRLDQHHDADYKLSDIEHLRHVLMTCYDQDLQICYQNEQAVINDTLDLNDLNQELCVFRNPKWISKADGTRGLPPATQKERDLWMEHWIDVYKSRTAAEKRADRFWQTNFPAKRHRFKEQKVRFADGTKTTSAH